MNLATTQLLSLLTKGITTALGIVQSFFIVHFLTKPEFGIAGLVISIGSIIGVTQHLGVVDGAIREIAILRGKREIGKVFWVAHLIRQAVTIPLSLGLMALASIVAGRIYALPEMTSFIQVYALSLILLGIQDVLGATLTGMKKFVALYIVQIGTSCINVVVFAYFTWRFATMGYFWAIIVTTTIMVVWYGLVITHYLGGSLQLPSWVDVRLLLRRVFRISLYMYVARILFVVWQRLPLLVLGLVIAKDQLGDLNLSLTFGSKLTILGMALSEVNLSLMSSLFVSNKQEFQRVVTRNMQRLLFLLVVVTAVLIFFTPEILHLPPLREYVPAQNLVIVMTVAFFMYSLIDVGTNSVFVAADQPRWRALLYALMTVVTGAIIAWLMYFRPDPFLSTIGVFFGVIAAYGATVYIAWRYLHIALLTRSIVIVLIALFFSMVWLVSSPSLGMRSALFVIFIAYLAYDIRRTHLLPRFASIKARYNFVCFAGAFYDAPTWTNRQHIMSRIAEQYPVLYVEPRVWIVRYALDHWRSPLTIARFCQRIIAWEQVSETLYVKAQWNLIPGSREYNWVGRLNHWLNRWNILVTAKLLGFGKSVLWLYDTEASEYLDSFPEAKVIYDCVDDHAVQAGPNRNSNRVRAEERTILKRANVVTVTSVHLYNQKKALHKNVHLVEQAADVALFTTQSTTEISPTFPQLGGPIIGSVGTLDSYKYDFALIEQVARTHPEWQFVFVGEPAVERRNEALARVKSLANVFVMGVVPRDRVPAYVQRFDVCMVPYQANDYNRSSFPLKFWEFMATGKPIVVSGLPELAVYTHLIGYAASADGFAREIQKALASPLVGREARIALAQEHSWGRRVATLLKLLEG